MVSEHTRAEHLKWCKDRAFEYINSGDLLGAFTSFASDVSKHSETEKISGTIVYLGMPLLIGGFLDTADEMRAHIEGYN